MPGSPNDPDDPGRRDALGRFGAGNNANPSGRPKQLREFHEWLKEKAYDRAQSALLAALDDPKTRLAAAREVFDRLFGTPRQQLDLRAEVVTAKVDLTRLTDEDIKILRAAHELQQRLVLPAPPDEEPRDE